MNHTARSAYCKKREPRVNCKGSHLTGETERAKMAISVEISLAEIPCIVDI